MIQAPIQASRTLSIAPSLSAALVRRRRPLMLTVPATYLPVVAVAPIEARPHWQEDLRFFIGCYMAGLAFFFIMLS